MNKDIVFLSELWGRVTDRPFSTEALLKRLRLDGGHDFSDFSDSDLTLLIEGDFRGDWSSVAFAFSELLAYYAAHADGIQGEKIVGWVFSSFTIADAIAANATEWEFNARNFIFGLLQAKGALNEGEATKIFLRVFGFVNLTPPLGAPAPR